MKLEITVHTPDRIEGIDEKGHFVMVRESIHTDGTPDEWEKVYYTPFPPNCGADMRKEENAK